MDKDLKKRTWDFAEMEQTHAALEQTHAALKYKMSCSATKPWSENAFPALMQVWTPVPLPVSLLVPSLSLSLSPSLFPPCLLAYLTKLSVSERE